MAAKVSYAKLYLKLKFLNHDAEKTPVNLLIYILNVIEFR